MSLIGPLTADGSSPDARRRILVKGIAKLIGSDFTFWAWGRGRPERGPVVPVAVISIGGSAAYRGWTALALSPLIDREIGAPIVPLARPQAATIRRDLFSDARWRGSEVRAAFIKEMGTDEWMYAVRYCGPDTWCNFFLARRKNKPAFAPVRSIGRPFLSLPARSTSLTITSSSTTARGRIRLTRSPP